MARKSRKTGGGGIGGVKGEYASAFQVVGVVNGSSVVLESGTAFGERLPNTIVKKWQARGSHKNIKVVWL